MWRIRTHFIRKSLLFSQWIYWIKPSTIFFPVARFLKNYTLYLCLFLVVVICCLILKIEPLHQKPDFDCVMLLDFFLYIFHQIELSQAKWFSLLLRWEAAQIPKVKVAKLDRSKFTKEQSVYMPQIPNIAECPEHLLPLKQWEDVFLADFSELRLVFFFLTSNILRSRLIVLFSFLLLQCVELFICITTFCFKLMPVISLFLNIKQVLLL